MTNFKYFHSLLIFFTLTFFGTQAFAQIPDSDNDGMPDAWENVHGLDPFNDLDASEDLDADLLSNLQEFEAGSNPHITDTDFDGVLDGDDIEPANPKVALDSDSDGLPDAWEMAHGLDPFNPDDANSSDHDFDNLTTLQEYQLGTDPTLDDSDRDGFTDEVDAFPLNAIYHLDSDSDGLPDEYEENTFFLSPFYTGDANDDHEGDGLSNLEEFLAGTNPDNPDSDYDYVFDGDDVAPLNFRYAYDTDQDGMPDDWEFENNLSVGYDDRWDDFDFDGLTNISEYLADTSPTNSDTDNDSIFDSEDHFPLNSQYRRDMDRDGIPEQFEFFYGFNDFDANDASQDADFDGLTNLQEFIAGTQAFNPDSDLDGVMDGEDLFPTDRTKALDSDLDGLPDSWEVINGLDPFYEGDALNDYDYDYLTVLEEYRLGTNINRWDSDGDGYEDSIDLFPLNSRYQLDHDMDGLPQAYEFEYGMSDSFAYDSVEDNDADDLTNAEEFLLGTNPNSHDSDNDGAGDSFDIAPTNPIYHFDWDNNGLPDQWEYEHGIAGFFSWEDTDIDGLSNLDEFKLGTDPNSPDTDNDGHFDGFEHFPLIPRFHLDSDRDAMPDSFERTNSLNEFDTYDGGLDFDYDNLNNSNEFIAGTSINHHDTDLDGIQDGDDLFPLNPEIALDSDQDGLPDAWEIINGLDPYFPFDAVEYHHDTDELSVIEEFILGTDFQKSDTDGDGILDHEDVFPLDARYQMDSDNDGMPDAFELTHGFSTFDSFDAREDPDLDQLTNLEEFEQGTHPHNFDTDMDGSADGLDIEPTNALYSADYNNNGLPDEWEGMHGIYSDYPWDDTDVDGLSNQIEYELGTLPNNPDTDNDGFFDGTERFPLMPQFQFDMDRDGIPNRYEESYGLNPNFTDDGGEDNDNDGLNNSNEFIAGTFINQPDSDFDGFIDGDDAFPANPSLGLDSDEDGLPDVWEIQNGLNPFDSLDALSQSHDFDLLSVIEEYRLGTDFTQGDTDSDGILDHEDPFPRNGNYTSDQDQDGLPYEFENSAPYLDDFNNEDIHFDEDQDGLSNLEEFNLGTELTVPDSDLDGIFDGDDVLPLDPNYAMDLDGDNLPDEWENEYGLNTNEADDWVDSDFDFLTNHQEFLLGTSPIVLDSDDDGVFDGMDRFPLHSAYSIDADQDGIAAAWELQNGLNDEDPADALLENNGSGQTNLEAFIAQLDSPSSIELTQGTMIGGSIGTSSFVFDSVTNTYTLDAGGASIGRWVDWLYFVYEEVQGDVDIQVNISYIENGWSSAGIMIRQDLYNGSPFAANMVEKFESGSYVRRFEPYTPAPNLPSPAQEGDWLRLQKEGDLITHSVSQDGTNWTIIGSDTYTMGETFYVGLVGITVESSPTSNFVFENVHIEATTQEE